MRKYYRMISAAFLCVLFLLLSLPAQAKMTVLEDSALKNVTKAGILEGEWIQAGKQYRFLQTDGSFAQNGWFCANGKIYYVNSRGNRVTGWVQYRNGLYYLGKNGALRTGWLERHKKRYFLRDNGKAARGLFSVGGETYYFDRKTGEARSGWIRARKNTYYFSAKTFCMKKNAWIKTDGKYYRVGKDGRKCAPGWLTVKKKKYYLDKNGARVTGTLYLDGKGYYFTEKGVYDPSVKPEVDPSRPMVALTFDDGPGKYTDRLLNCLKNNNAKATFFMVGSSVPYYQATVKRMADMGCELGNHSYSHTSFTSLSGSGIASEISRTSSNIRAAAGRGPTLCRLPYGNGHSTSWVLSSLGLPSIYWSIDTRDWANTGNPSHTVSEVLNHVKSGDIVLMHDIHYSTVVAAETIIPALKQRGYQLVTVSELAKYKGKTTLYSGRTYYHF